MPRGEKVEVTPTVLRWVRESKGIPAEAVAERLDIDLVTLSAWETGTDQPTMPQLRKLADMYRRPTAMFFLPEPPEETRAKLPDFRLLPDEEISLSPQLIEALDVANDRREVALEIAAAMGLEVRPFTTQATMKEKPEAVALRAREVLGVGLSDQRACRGEPYACFNLWRSAVEQLDVLVFQAPEIEISEMRGFSVAAERYPVVVVNPGDAAFGRVFTMLHEFAHLMLRKSGICDTHDEGIEAFCNEVAASILMPRNEFLAEVGDRSGPWDESDLRALTREFGASTEAVARRLTNLGRMTTTEYRAWRSLLAKRPRQPSRGGSYWRTKVGRYGRGFISLVLSAYRNEAITGSRLASYLDMKITSLEQLEAEL
jgi:Zn-dependent peptidase ImmA (M78 family)/transcriptional regulator with XRE-family HTH domain